MTRRTFSAGLAATAVAASNTLVLEAIHGERLPATLKISRRKVGEHPYFELRTYRGDAALHSQLERVLSQATLRPLSLATLSFLVPFDSLQQRARTWDQLNFDPGWIALRDRLRLTE